MQIHLISVGTRMPLWVQQGFDEYRKRLPRESALKLLEVQMKKRTKNCDIQRLIAAEGKQILSLIPPAALIIAMDLSGKQWSTEQLASALEGWQLQYRHVALLVGGPDGLSKECLDRANQRWCLSELTFPHPLVRIIIAEQLYRSWSLLENHPYHR